MTRCMKQIRPSAMILDGGLATELQARGCDISGALWSELSGQL
jgi:S-methylmethionine-dependent homocysteine/selenocysteine methylase